MFPHRHLDVLQHVQRGEQRPHLEHDAELLVERLACIGIGFFGVHSQNFDSSRPLWYQAENGAQEHGLAGARCADHPEDLSPIGIEIEVFEHICLAESGRQPAYPDHDLPVAGSLASSVVCRFGHAQ